MKDTDTTPRIVVTPATPDTERLAPPVPPADGTLVIPQQANQPIAPASPAAAAAEDLYAQYAVLGMIGDGGMGVVYLARDRKLGRHVAIKRLKPNAQSNPSLRRRFLHEARAAAALGHPHIVHVYGLGEDAEGPYIVMEYVAGELAPDPGVPGSPPPPQTLEQYVGRHGALSVSAAADLLAKLGRAVAYAHACGVIHRDLKPSNILMDPTGEPKIVDFGLARLMRAEDSKLTVPGEKLLSLGYGAPEQESDASVSDERADVYGLGALLYFVLTGQNPRYFREEDLPVSIRPLLCKAIARDRELRWPTVTALTDALCALQSHTQVELPTVKTTWRCKWCDTVNPLTTRFCAECGWDGGESCLECGADTHVGVLFCRTCGANARDYEQVATTIAKSQQSIEARQYDAAIAFASRAISLEPAGANGRRMLEQLRELRATAEKKLTRREQLKDLVHVELRAENYERAQRFIQELRGLSPDQTLFSAQLAQIPELTIRRDLTRVRRAFREKDWEQGVRLLESVREMKGDGQPEFARLVRQLRTHRRSRSARRVAAVAATLVALYGLAFPPVARYAHPPRPRWLTAAFAPAAFAYRASPANRVLSPYARLWQASDDTAAWAPAAPAATNAPPTLAAPNTPPSDAFAKLATTYRGQVTELQTEYQRSMEAWPPDYRRALKTQRDRHQATGDFNGWHAVNTELTRFETEGGILPPTDNDPDDLRKLKADFAALLERYQVTRVRKLVAATRRHVMDLESLRSELTRAGQMEVAEGVNREILRLQDDPDFVDAKRRLAAFEANRPDADIPAYVGVASDGLGEMSGLRVAYEEERRKVEEDYAAKVEAWPNKYVEALEKFMETRQSEGDYLGWEAASFELDRFELDRTLTPGEFVAGEGPLDQLKQRFAALRDEYAMTRARGLVKASEHYTQKLDTLLSQYTKSNKIEAATLVNGELRRVKADPDLQAAQRLLDSRLPEASPATREPSAPQGP